MRRPHLPRPFDLYLSISLFGPSEYTLFAIPIYPDAFSRSLIPMRQGMSTVYPDALSRSLISARQGRYTLFAINVLCDALSRSLLSVRQGIRCLQSTYTLTPSLDF